MTHFLSSKRRRGQARAIEALLAVFLMIAAIFTATFYSTTTSQVSGGNLQQTANNLLYALDSSNALQGILSASGNWQAQLQQLIQSLLPAGTYFNANVLLSNGTVLNTFPIGDMGGLQFGETENVSYVVSVSLPSPYAKMSTVPTKFDVVLVNDISGSMEWVEPNITQSPPAQCSYDGAWICPLYPGQNSKQQNARIAATAFVNDLNVSANGDHVGIITIGNAGDIRSYLNSSKTTVLSTISNLIAQAQATYTSDALYNATKVFAHARPQTQSQWVLVMLTDGYPTYPGDGYDFSVRGADDSIGNATILENMNVTIFTIGLGVQIDPGLLTAIASTPSDFYYSPTSQDLTGIYQVIANRLHTGVGLTSETVILQIELAESG